MNLFFDLDGTLLDSKRRLYTLFQDLVSKSTLSVNEYWELKRNKIDHKAILLNKFNYTEIDYINFESKFLEQIESPGYLKLDILFYGVCEMLGILAQKNKIFIITSRQNKENTFVQLKKLDIYKYFENILVTERKYEKVELIRKLQFQNEDFIIGDTDYDILTGKQLGIHTIAVSYGFLNKQKLNEYNPEYIVDNLAEIGIILQ